MIDTAPDTSLVLSRILPAANGLQIGYAQLNAEKSLNALSLPMIEQLHAQLRAWADDPSIACVVIHGAGDKALCAGGDVRSLYRNMRAQPGAVAIGANLPFFNAEYRLDHFCHRYPKPLLVWGSGIVMGGGIGVMVGASHRLVTETTRGAMPEITIGLFPDVGGSWFLGRLPPAIGLFLGLTGCSINAHDMLHAQLADHFVRAGDREAIFAMLTGLDWSGEAAQDRARLTQALQPYADSAAPLLPESNLLRHAALLASLTAGDSIAEICARLTAYDGDDAWLKQAVQTLAAGAPLSLALTDELLRRGRTMSLAEVLRMEMIVALRCSERPNFAEGVRALLIDKDRKPRWTPATLAGVTAAEVEAHFVAPWSEGAHPLADLGA